MENKTYVADSEEAHACIQSVRRQLQGHNAERVSAAEVIPWHRSRAELLEREITDLYISVERQGGYIYMIRTVVMIRCHGRFGSSNQSSGIDVPFNLLGNALTTS